MISLYNTLHRQVEVFKPIKKNRVGMYTCGPTVYNYAHIGNLRTYVFEDILKRVLRFNGLKVKHVMNITDVGHLTDDADAGEDKMEKGSRREGKTAWEIAKFYTAAFQNDLRDLNIEEPGKWCRATDYIKAQINLIKKIEKNGFTYRTSDGIYFDTSKLPSYGELALLNKQNLKAGARVDLGEKKNPTDFALWKFSPTGEKRQMEWKSPWGVGFPGWHIECSAMSEKFLGAPFDIHCGGIDHIPVHHTNEIAQTQAGYGKPLANYWLHGEFLLTGGAEKMAKSGENFLTLSVLKEKNMNPLAYRYFLLQTHYRRQLNFSWEALGAAQNGLEHLYKAAAVIPSKFRLSRNDEESLSNIFLQFINNNLDIPGALAFVWEKIKTKQIDQKTIFEFDKVLGLNIKKQLTINKETKTETMSNELLEIIKQRDSARQNKDWKTSDELRKKLEEMGYRVEDTPGGTNVTTKISL